MQVSIKLTSLVNRLPIFFIQASSHVTLKKNVLKVVGKLEMALM